MQFSASTWRRVAVAAVVSVGVFLVGGCSGSGSTRGANFLGTFRMGERVQAPPIVYNVLEAEWKPELGPGGRAPKHRFLFVRVSATNSGGQTVSIPPFQLESKDGQTTYQEETDKMDAVRNWLGMIRSVEPAQTETGYVVFDVPIGPYKLLMYDGGEPEKERYAIVEIPVILE